MPGAFQGWFEVVLPGWRPVHGPLVVMDLLVAAGAEEAHVVDVGVAFYGPGDDVVGLAPVCVGAASHTCFVAGGEGYPLGGAGGSSFSAQVQRLGCSAEDPRKYVGLAGQVADLLHRDRSPVAQASVA